jgi:hypothetical protein
VNGPAWNSDARGTSIRRASAAWGLNTPIWLLSVMGKSGLFQPWAIKLAEVIVVQEDEESGGFTYWPDGPLRRPKRSRAAALEPRRRPHNTAMYHRGESNGPSTSAHEPEGPRLRLHLSRAIPPIPTTGNPDGRPRSRATTDQLRSRHWDAELYADLADLKKHVDHLDDLTPDRVFETFWKTCGRGRDFEMPSDPMRDRAFIELLATTYDISTSSYPAEAPVAAHA